MSPADVFEAAFASVMAWESAELSLNPADRGNYTPAGVLLGSKYGISARYYSHLDIPDLTLEQVREIFRSDYWDRIAADTLPPPLAFIASDSAFNQGVGRAKELLAQSDGDYVTFGLLRLEAYTRNKADFPVFGRGWKRRAVSTLAQAHAIARGLT